MLAEYKQQNDVLGPPLELGIEEVTYAVETGEFREIWPSRAI